jgi:hypothetical protein
MANLGKWGTPGTLTTVLSTGLNSLGNATMSAASSTYANDTSLDLYVDVEVVLASLSPTSGAYVSIYLWEAVDGATFPAQSDADLRLTTTQLLCVIPVGTTAATAQRVVARNLLLSPAKVQFKLDNQTGVALNASGNTVKILPYSFDLNG